MAGSFSNFRGISATGPEVVEAAVAADALGGGDTGRVADCGRALASFLLFVGVDDTVATVPVPFIDATDLSLLADKPVNTARGDTVREFGTTLGPSSFALLSLWRFAGGSLPNAELEAESDGMVAVSTAL